MAFRALNGVDVNGQRIVAVADPSANTDAANKQYVDNRISGLSWKDEVRVATTTNGTLATAFANGQSIDGLTIATGDRLLLKDQSAPAENGLYIVPASGAPTRATDADSTAELNNATVFITDGTVGGGKTYTQTTKNPTVGSSSLVWAIYAAGQAYTADGLGIELVSTTFSLELDGTTLSKSGAGVRVGSGAAGAGLVEASGVLAVGAGTGVLVAADSISIDTSVVARKNSANCATANPWVQAHGFATADLEVSVREVSTGTRVYADVVIDTTNITITLPAAPTAAQYRVTWMG